MLELRPLWEEYAVIEKSGQGRNKRALEIESIIHQAQLKAKTAPYDFDARWEKNRLNGLSTVSGPPPVESKPVEPEVFPPQANFTVEEAKKILGENDCALLEYCANIAEARMIYLAHILDKLNPENRNVARRGQGTNIANSIFTIMKTNGESIPDDS